MLQLLAMAGHSIVAAMMVTNTLGMSVMADWCMWCSLTWLIMMRLLYMLFRLKNSVNWLFNGAMVMLRRIN